MRMAENCLLEMTLSKSDQKLRQKPRFRTTETWINPMTRINDY